MFSKKEKKRIIIVASVLFLAVFSVSFKFTNDTVQGYVEGRLTYVSAQYSGRLTDLLVSRGDKVNLNTPLFKLEVAPQSLDLQQAQSRLEQAQKEITSKEAALKLAGLVLKRSSTLETEHSISIQAADEARTNFKLAKIAKEQAEMAHISAISALEETKWQLNQKEIHSAKKAQVFDTYYLKGELVPDNKPVLSLLSDEDKSIIFYLPIKQLSRVKIGQTITILDVGDKKIKAKISFINPNAEYTPPIIYSVESNEKLVYRVEAKPFDGYEYLHPGLPVRLSLKDEK